MVTLAKSGDKAYADKYEIIMRRESKYPNQIWQVDHCLLSIKVIHKDKIEEHPWLTIIIDDFSRCIMGFCLYTGAPSAMQTALALRKAIWYKQDKTGQFVVSRKYFIQTMVQILHRHILSMCAQS